jgi:hypothetical protein
MTVEEDSPESTATSMISFGPRARMVIVAVVAVCWLLFALVAYFVVFFGPDYIHWIFIAIVVGLIFWGIPKLSYYTLWLSNLDLVPYRTQFGRRSESLKFVIQTLFLAYCGIVNLVPGPPEVRVAIGVVLVLLPVSAEILLPTAPKARPHLYHLLSLIAAMAVSLPAVILVDLGH